MSITVGQQAKKRIENAEQLPVHSYPVPGKASVLLTDDAAFKVFVAALQKDLENDLQNYDIEDKTTLKRYYGPLMQIAILEQRYNQLLTIVEDDGRGFDVEAVTFVPDEGRGLGLLGIQERVALIGGNLKIESQPSAGTTLVTRIPIYAFSHEEGFPA